MTRPYQQTGLACPTCGDPFRDMAALDGEAWEGVATPAPGDVLLCMTCGEICVLDDACAARTMTEPEAQALHPETVQVLAMAEAARQRVMRRLSSNPFGRDSVPRVGRDSGEAAQ